MLNSYKCWVGFGPCPTISFEEVETYNSYNAAKWFAQWADTRAKNSTNSITETGE